MKPWEDGMEGVPRGREGERRARNPKATFGRFPQLSSFSDCPTYFNEAPESGSHPFEISKCFPITMSLVSLLDLKYLSQYPNPIFQLVCSRQVAVTS